MQQGATNLACPNCQKDDMVQKVTAAVGAGISATVVPGRMNMVVANQTLISNRLLLPPRPKISIAEHIGMFILYTFIYFISLWAIATFIFSFNFGNFALSDFVGIAEGAIGSVIGIGLFLFISRRRQRYRKQMPVKIQAWEKYAEAWKQLFYCARCDGVFIPGKSPFIPMDEKDRFLSQF